MLPPLKFELLHIWTMTLAMLLRLINCRFIIIIINGKQTATATETDFGM